jgi:3',5'-cyclic AMP phosphodiesterase CpdA
MFRIGLFADAQFADIEPRASHEDRERIKYFREAKGRLAGAFEYFKGQASGLNCVINLGDLYNGVNHDNLKGRKGFVRAAGCMSPQAIASNRRDLDIMVGVMRDHHPGVPVYHCLGNHDLNLPREEVLETLRSPAAYFTTPLTRGWRLVILDTTDINPRFSAHETKEFVEGMRFLSEALDASRKDLRPWGGGVGSAQMRWLKDTLADAEAKRERVIIATHNPLAPGSAREGFVAWNSEELAGILEASPAVAICVSGHDHCGGYALRGLTHYVTLEAMLEAPAGSTAYAILEVWPDLARLHGFGIVTSRELQITPMPRFTGIANSLNSVMPADLD